MSFRVAQEGCADSDSPYQCALTTDGSRSVTSKMTEFGQAPWLLWLVQPSLKLSCPQRTRGSSFHAHPHSHPVPDPLLTCYFSPAQHHWCLSAAPHPYVPFFVNSTSGLLKIWTGSLKSSSNPPYPSPRLLTDLLPLAMAHHHLKSNDVSRVLLDPFQSCSVHNHQLPLPLMLLSPHGTRAHEPRSARAG